MKNGENYTKKFEQGDWFKLTITGLNADGETTGTVDFYLADLRSENESEHYILNEWKWCDLSSLGEVKRLEFTMSSTDNDPQWGMNTPAYFCMDNLGVTAPVPTAVESIAKHDNANAAECYDLNGVRRSATQRGLNIVRMTDGTVRKVLMK